tara:strand:- start:1829 stop:2557 length:729 start_codon:yes stop_codon:yes gene_type:complete
MSQEKSFLKIFQYSETSVLLELKAEPKLDLLNELIVFKNLLNSNLCGIKQITLSYKSLLLQFSNPLKKYKNLKEEILKLYSSFDSSKSTIKSKHWNIPVCYESKYASDLSSISEYLKLSHHQLIELHTKPIYQIYFIGFLPGFLYLGGLDTKLYHPRKKSPTLKVSKGAVGIGGRQTGIYPNQSPGGWNIIGTSPTSMFDPDLKQPCFAKSGDTLSFYSISETTFKKIRKNKIPPNFSEIIL